MKSWSTAAEVAAKRLNSIPDREERMFLQGIVETWLRLCDLFKMRKAFSRTDSVCCELVRFTQNNGLSAVVDSFKFSTSAHMSHRFRSNEHLEPPSDYFNFKSQFGISTILRKRMLGQHTRSDRVAFTLAMLKRGCPPLPSKLVDQALVKHEATLTQVKATPEVILNFVESHISKIFKDFEFDENSRGPVSRSSSLERSRSKGGSQAVVSDNIIFTKPKAHEGKYSDLARFALQNSRSLTNFHQQKELAISFPRPWSEQPVKVKSVDDVLKSRTITVESASNWPLKPLVTSMNRFLSRKSHFQLMRGAPVSECLRKMSPRPEDSFVSGDYAAATDNLNKDITNVVGEVLAMKLDRNPRLQSLWRENFGSHVLRYSCNEKHKHNKSCKTRDVRQTNGQLMGSLTSFNHLCLINDAVYNYCRSIHPEWYGKCHFINGDDILFLGTSDGLKFWKESTAQCGLEASYGKNFFSKDLLTVNSHFFRFNWETREYTECPFINFKLFNVEQDEKCVLSEDYKPSVGKTKGTMFRSLCSKAGVKVTLSDKGLSRSLRVHFFEKCRRIPVHQQDRRDIFLPTVWGGQGALQINDLRDEHLPISANRVRDIVHGTRLRGQDSVSRASEFESRTLEILPSHETRSTISPRSIHTQYVFSGMDANPSRKTRSPCPKCKKLARQYKDSTVTPSTVELIRRDRKSVV